MAGATPKANTIFSGRSRIGLNSANFFQAEAVGVILPVLNGFLRDSHWRYDAIGVATAIAGLGTLLFQTPAGIITDKITARRMLFAGACMVTGLCFVLLPLVPRTFPWIDSLLFASGVAQSFFAPLLGALALALVGHAALGRVLGENQSWNHAGNITAALIAIGLVRSFGEAGVFYSVGFVSMIGAASVFLIRRSELDEQRGAGRRDGKIPQKDQSWQSLLSDRVVLALFVSISLFHLANAPILPLTALYVKKLGGSDSLMTSTVLIAQIVMVPVAWLSGKLCQSWGRKPVMAIGFWILPLRIASYTLTHSPRIVVILQSLDGIGAGIYGVVVVAMVADLTAGKGKFNTLLGLLATAQAVGGVVGPVISGLLVQHLGFAGTFWSFAMLALMTAWFFMQSVPETRPKRADDFIPAAAT
jgi:MFS family permease